MPEASFSVHALVLFAFLFGLRHGLDADHLAMIDGMARLQARTNRPWLPRLCGVFFSLGHGFVLLVAASLLRRLSCDVLPPWIDPLGALISIVFLIAVGVGNLRNALGGNTGRPSGIIAKWVLNLPLLNSFFGAVAVGGLFALSFDAMAIAAWLGIAGSAHDGMATTALLASAFVAGMIIVDGINGLLMSMLIRQSEQFVKRARRLFSVAVACSALGMAIVILAKLALPTVDNWSEGKEMLFTAFVLLLTLTGFFIARNQSEGRTQVM